jgi:hypothetical protein
VLYDSVEQAYVIASANFATDIAALTTAKGVTALGAVTIIKRQRAETSKRLANPATTLKTLGIYVTRAMTQAKDQQKRDSLSTLVYDLYVEGLDPSLLAKQAELGVEALLRSIDRFAVSGAGVFGAGELLRSVNIQMSDGYEETVTPRYWHRAEVTFPVHDRDEGL